MLYLNNVDSGGETYFNNFDLGIQPISGRLVMFPAQYPFMHESKSPISNDKFAVVTWFKQVINDPQK